MSLSGSQPQITGFQPRVAGPGEFEFRREHFGLLNVLYLTGAFVNLLVAMVTGSVDAYRVLPAWFLLLSLSAASSFLKEWKGLAWILTVALCVGIEFLRYREYHTEILFRTAVNYAPLTAFMLILFAARVEERKTFKDQAYARLQMLRNDSNDKLKMLKKMRSGETEDQHRGQEDTIRSKKLIFEIYQELFPKILRIRYKRDIPPILQQASQQCFGLSSGVIYEIPPEKTGEVQIRSRWGLEEGPRVDEALARFARGDLVRTCSDSRAPMQPDQIKRRPNLYEEMDQFAEALFPIECLYPCLLLGRTAFVMIAGKPGSKGRVPYEFSLLNPIFLGCGQAISKLAQKDGRASFSMFGA